MITLQLASQTVDLLPERAAFWHEQQTLIIADLHLGKTAFFQRAGIATPEGPMQEDVTALEKLIKKTAPEHCIVVGDLIHAKGGLTEDVVELFSSWLTRQPCTFTLIIGNHDRALLKQLPPSWNITMHKDSLLLPPFSFTHIPQKLAGHFTWSGHLHPQVIMRNQADILRLRCFLIEEGLAILPAFSSFVGGHTVHRQAGRRLFVTTGNEVIEI